MSRLPESFYTRDDVVKISKELLGKRLVTKINGTVTAGMIVETEAYAGETDRASHAYGGRRTNRTTVMYKKGGSAYVYLCYGIHDLFNIVSNEAEIPHAILIRALAPVLGIEKMLERCHKKKPDHTLTSGPGKVSRALGITTKHSGEDLVTSQLIWVEDTGVKINPRNIGEATRVGVAYAKEDALRPYRFFLKDNPWVSRGKGLPPSS